MIKGLATTQGAAMKKFSGILCCITPKVMDSIASWVSTSCGSPGAATVGS
jgi:hypothetical protein